MRLSTEVIQTRVLEDFEAQLNEFYKQCENTHLDQFRNYLINNHDNIDYSDYKSLCQEETKRYKDELAKSTLQFIRNYIDEAFDVVINSLNENIFNKEEAEAAFNALRHILIAAEIENDEAAKLS